VNFDVAVLVNITPKDGYWKFPASVWQMC